MLRLEPLTASRCSSEVSHCPGTDFVHNPLLTSIARREENCSEAVGQILGKRDATSGGQSLTKEPVPESASVVTWYVVPLFPPVAMAPNPTAPANAFCAFAPEKRAAAAEAKRERVLSIMASPTKATIEIIKDNSRVLMHHSPEMKSTSTYTGRYPWLFRQEYPSGQFRAMVFREFGIYLVRISLQLAWRPLPVLRGNNAAKCSRIQGPRQD